MKNRSKKIKKVKKQDYQLWRRLRVKIERERRKELAMELTIKITRNGQPANGLNLERTSHKKH